MATLISCATCTAGFVAIFAFAGFGLRLGWQIAGLIF